MPTEEQIEQATYSTLDEIKDNWDEIKKLPWDAAWTILYIPIIKNIRELCTGERDHKS